MASSRALLSVHNKDGIVDLASALAASNYELVSSGGTAKVLKDGGLAVTTVESITGNPEAFQGRMKTLSFQIESAILYDRKNPSHRKEAESLGLVPIDVVVCNFYPFQKAVDENLPMGMAIELIDIGGPAMVRAAAKNFEHVLVIADPKDYKVVAEFLRTKQAIPRQTRLRLAAKAFQITADYDGAIDAYFESQSHQRILRLAFKDGQALRYGENPQQKGEVFWNAERDPLSLHHFKQLSGKELSFNNYLDSDAAVNTLTRMGGERPACVIVKHANPCGAAYGENVEEAFLKAWDGDSVAAFGGIVALNRPMTSALVEKFIGEKKFAEIFLAPSIVDSALTALMEKKRSPIILVNVSLASPIMNHQPDFKKIRGGILVQAQDSVILESQNLEVASERKPTDEEIHDLLFAWNIARESKSNTIVLTKGGQLVGSGAGQQDRVRACKLAVEKAGSRALGARAASDGFFPFPDGPEVLIKAGITAILHPGGSIRDSETILVCNKHGVALLTTKGIRAFKH